MLNREKKVLNIEMYTTMTCPYCDKAKDLLKKKKVEFKEIRIDTDSGKRKEMIRRSGRTSVPQIFINSKHIGGCDDLYELDARAELDPLLK
ncbi:glutaredoxin 3 [Candidatus Ishikawella capsulata]|uniref:Glutaredoxin n=1 Tax=Candidatus Ishikawaella capsulata Mpkobe TaxID=476281 RepID=C5WDR9_9ENTR|nr:glutaredoxin 3 [Candidatus Ishikawaella capsulata]BAH83475.1 glutaredoxin 3 [Candidatus Ishikawaella capsulata Mpkobe]